MFLLTLVEFFINSAVFPGNTVDVFGEIDECAFGAFLHCSLVFEGFAIEVADCDNDSVESALGFTV